MLPEKKVLKAGLTFADQQQPPLLLSRHHLAHSSYSLMPLTVFPHFCIFSILSLLKKLTKLGDRKIGKKLPSFFLLGMVQSTRKLLWKKNLLGLNFLTQSLSGLHISRLETPAPSFTRFLGMASKTLEAKI